MDTPKEKYAGTQSLARTFNLIRLFDDQRPYWSLVDLIDASGLTRTTTFRLLSALEAEGVIRRSESGDYALGSELIVLGGRAIRASNLRTVARPFMQQLVLDSAESVTIDTLWIDDNGRPMSMVIEETLGRHVMGMAQYIGGRFPAHTTSTGKVLLAWQSDELLAGLDLLGLEQRTGFTVDSAEILQQELADIRQQGHATTSNELEIGLTAVAAPIFNHHNDIQAALCIAGPTSRIIDRLPELVSQVVETALKISNEIGFRV